jgi:hypothetical protein
MGCSSGSSTAEFTLIIFASVATPVSSPQPSAIPPWRAAVGVAAEPDGPPVE